MEAEEEGKLETQREGSFGEPVAADSTPERHADEASGPCERVFQAPGAAGQPPNTVCAHRHFL